MGEVMQLTSGPCPDACTLPKDALPSSSPSCMPIVFGKANSECSDLFKDGSLPNELSHTQADIHKAKSQVVPGLNLQSQPPKPKNYCQAVSGTRGIPHAPMKLKFHQPTAEGGRRVVSPPPEVAAEGCKIWENCLVGYMVEKKLPFSAVQTIAHKVWGNKGLCEVLANENGFYFFKFSEANACSTILETGPWLFAGKPFFLKKWQPGLILTKESHSKIPIWAKFYNVPHEFWTGNGLSYIASAVGRPLYADSLTETHKRISFARVCIEVDASSELIDSFDLMLNGDVPGMSPTSVEIKVDYQWKPKICTLCKSFGHTTGSCKKEHKPMVWVKKQVEIDVPPTKESGSDPTYKDNLGSVVVNQPIDKANSDWSKITNPIELVAAVRNFKGDKHSCAIQLLNEPLSPAPKITSPNPFQVLNEERDFDSDQEPSTASPDKSLWPSKLLGKNIDGAPIVAGSSISKKKNKKQKKKSAKEGKNSPGTPSNLPP
jgi:hypothetical protein